MFCGTVIHGCIERSLQILTVIIIIIFCLKNKYYSKSNYHMYGVIILTVILSVFYGEGVVLIKSV